MSEPRPLIGPGFCASMSSGLHGRSMYDRFHDSANELNKMGLLRRGGSKYSAHLASPKVMPSYPDVQVFLSDALEFRHCSAAQPFSAAHRLGNAGQSRKLAHRVS